MHIFNSMLLKDFLNFVIRNKNSEEGISKKITEYLNFVENIMHFEDCKNSYYVNYSILKLSSLINTDDPNEL